MNKVDFNHFFHKESAQGEKKDFDLVTEA